MRDVGKRPALRLPLPVHLGAERAQDVQHEADHDEEDADVEEQGRDEVHVTEDTQLQHDLRRLQDHTAEDQRHHARTHREEQASSEQGAGQQRRRLTELVAAAGEVAHGQGDARDDARRETSAGRVVPGEQQEDGEEQHGVERQPGGDLEDHRPALGGEGRPTGEPLAASAAAGTLGSLVRARPTERGTSVRQVGPHRRLRGVEVTHPLHRTGAGPQEHERGDAGRRHQEHGDLTHGVPGTDIHERDVDDVAAVAELVRLLGEQLGDGPVHADGRCDQREEGHGQPDEDREDGAPPPARRKRSVRVVRGQAAQDEHEDNERHGLHERLGQGEVGCAVEREEDDHAVARDAEEHHGLEAPPGPGGEERADDDDDRDDALDRRVPVAVARGPQTADDGGAADEDHHGHQDDAEVDGQRTTLGVEGHGRGEPVQPTHHAAVGAVRVRPQVEGVLHALDAGSPHREQHATHDDHAGQQERCAEAAPQDQVAGLTGGVGVRVGREQRLTDHREESGHHPGDGEQVRGNEQPGGLTVDGAGRHPLLAPERPPQETHPVGEREDRAEHHYDEEDDVGRPLALGEGLQRGLLGDVPGRGRQADHRQGREHAGDGGPRQCAAEPGQLTQVAGPGGGVDHANREEESGLEHRVRPEEHEPGQGDPAVRLPHEQDEEAELADGAEGEQQLEVVLAQRPVPAEQHRGGAEGEDRPPPDGHLREARGEAGDEVDARLDHGRGVQIGAHRRRRRHRAGQPEVERDERGLAQGADEDEDQRHRHEGSRRGGR